MSHGNDVCELGVVEPPRVLLRPLGHHPSRAKARNHLDWSRPCPWHALARDARLQDGEELALADADEAPAARVLVHAAVGRLLGQEAHAQDHPDVDAAGGQGAGLRAAPVVGEGVLEGVACAVVALGARPGDPTLEDRRTKKSMSLGRCEWRF